MGSNYYIIPQFLVKKWKNELEAKKKLIHEAYDTLRYTLLSNEDLFDKIHDLILNEINKQEDQLLENIVYNDRPDFNSKNIRKQGLIHIGRRSNSTFIWNIDPSIVKSYFTKEYIIVNNGWYVNDDENDENDENEENIYKSFESFEQVYKDCEFDISHVGKNDIFC
jgi:hypothetical protein